MPAVSPNEERIGGYRLRRTGDALILDERASHPLLDIPRVLFGLAFMLPAYFFFGVIVLPDGVLGVRPSEEMDRMSVTAWLPLVPFLCIPIFFFLVGFTHAFSRTRVVVAGGGVRIGKSWFGIAGALTNVDLAKCIELRLGNTRRGMFGGSPGFRLSLAFDSKEHELFCCWERHAAVRLARALQEQTKLPVRDLVEY